MNLEKIKGKIDAQKFWRKLRVLPEKILNFYLEIKESGV